MHRNEDDPLDPDDPRIDIRLNAFVNRKSHMKRSGRNHDLLKIWGHSNNMWHSKGKGSTMRRTYYFHFLEHYFMDVESEKFCLTAK